MQITEDPTALVSGADMLRWFAGLLGAYLLVALWLGFKTDYRKFWKPLVILSLLATCLWFMLDLVLSFLVIMDRPSDIPEESYALSATFGIPWGWNLPAGFLPLPANDVPTWLHLICTIASVGVVLFALALLLYLLGQVLSGFRRQIRSNKNASS